MLADIKAWAENINKNSTTIFSYSHLCQNPVTCLQSILKSQKIVSFTLVVLALLHRKLPKINIMYTWDRG